MCKLSRYEDLYTGQYNVLLSYAMSIFHDRSQCEEMVQETFLIAWKKVDALLNSPNPYGWLMNTLKFTIKNYNKKLQRESFECISFNELLYISDQSNSLEETVCAQHVGEVYGTRLRPREVYILEQVILEGYSCKEVAKILGIKYGTCQKQFQRAVNKVRKAHGRS